MGDDDTALQAYYARDNERDRLEAGVGRLEFLRTVEVIARTLPPAPASIADIGGGPGRYTDWLVERGHTVVHRDLVPHHVAQVQERHAGRVDTAIGDARRLDLADESVDVVLLLGPIYHLREREERLHALREASRVVRDGGLVHVAAISRWAARLHGVLIERVHQTYPAIISMIDEMERTGWMAPIVDGGFTGYAHTPAQLRDEVQAAGLVVEALVALEGIGVALGDLDVRMNDPDEARLLLDTLRAVEAVPDLLGVGPHLLITARKQ